jgi:recombination protein RecA
MIDKSGSWYSYGEERIGQGRENAKQFMRENTEILNAIRSKILEKKGIPLAKRSVDDQDAANQDIGVLDGSR